MHNSKSNFEKFSEFQDILPQQASYYTSLQSCSLNLIMNRNTGYYYDTSDSTAVDSSLMSSNLVNNCPNSGICGISSMCNGSGDGCGDSTASTQIYEGNYSAPGQGTLNSNRLPNIYQVFCC